MRDIEDLDGYRNFLRTFNWYHDLEKDFQEWVRQKNELMYLRSMAEKSGPLFKHVFNLYWCANYGTNPAHAPFQAYTYSEETQKKEYDERIRVPTSEVIRLREELGIKLQPEKWR